MKKYAYIFLISFLFCHLSYGQTTWIIDPTHSTIQFEVDHLSVTSVTGQFTSFSGTVITDGENFDGAELNTTVQVASITTHNLERDKHLKDEDFFYVEKYPEIKFESTSFEKKEGNQYTIKGNLTIRGVTKLITLKAEYGGIVSINQKKKAGFEATGTIDRFEYGLSWDDVLDSGGLIVGEKVDIIIKVELVKQ